MPCLVRTKSGIYYVAYCRNGKRSWKSTRTRDKKQAQRIFLLASTDAPIAIPQKLSICMLEFIQYVETNFAPRTKSTYQYALNNLLRAVGDIEIGTITTLAIERYKNQRALKVSPATVNIELRTIRAFFNCLKRWDLVTKNPCDGVQKIRIVDGIPAYLKFEDLRRLLALIQDPWLKEIVTFAAMTGTRLGEITNLSWEDVNLATRTIMIRSNDVYRVKAGKIRVIPMNETLVRLLQEKDPKEGLVFKGRRGGRANGNYVSENFRSAVRQNGFDRGLHFHSLRHTFASLLVSNGTSLYHVQKLLGHSSSKVTEIYSHLQISGLHNVVASINLY